MNNLINPPPILQIRLLKPREGSKLVMIIEQVSDKYETRTKDS